ncbi:MAG: hypothetical protein QM692_22230 [Thermomicrobiales bacterium]
MNDIVLNGAGYAVVEGTYRKTSAPGAVGQEVGAHRLRLGPFGGGQRQALAPVTSGGAGGAAVTSGAGRGWDSAGVGPCFDGQGVEPFPHAASFSDSMSDIPSASVRAYSVVTGNNAWVGMGRRIYKSVALTTGSWSALSVAADLGAGYAISGLAAYQDDLLIMLSTGQEIRKLNTTTNTVTIWRAGERGVVGCGYAGQLVYAPRAAGAQEELRLSGTKWNGNAETHLRSLDSPIISMALFNGKVAIATRSSLYLMGGRPYPGEADDPSVTADTSKAPAWLGEPEPVMTHGQFAADDDFTFLCSYRGRLYTWLAGRVAEYDDSTEEGRWVRMGPEAKAGGCRGAAVAGDWLVVAIEGRYNGARELWGFNGSGWWPLASRETPGMLWPCAVGGAGDRDLLVFRDSVTLYDLYRLKWRSSSVHTYAPSGAWTSSLLDAGAPDRDKTWRAIGAVFAAPAQRGNAASSDGITVALEYGLDDGATWQTAASAATTQVTRRGVALQSSFEVAFAGLPTSRRLQLRVSWSSIADWAPVLVDCWAEYTVQENAPPRRRWEFTIAATDRRPRRDGALEARTGRQRSAALWDAWEGGRTLAFQEADGGLWDPSHLPGLALWLKADALGGLLDGDLIPAWPDASGNGEIAAQTDAAHQPVYRAGAQNGLPAARFAGDHWLTVASQLGITAQPFSQFAVWKPGGTAQALMIWANSTGLLVTDLDNDLGISSGSALFNLNQHPFAQWHLVAGVHAGAGSSLTVDGGTPVTGSAGAGFPSGSLTIGAGVAGGDRWLSGDLGELIITRTALSAAERQRLEGYTAHKWGLAALLPPAHPFRAAPPVVSYRVRIEQIEERVARPSDAARWGESQIALTLAET